MAIKVGINGFGRIGRLVFRVMAEKPEKFDVVGDQRPVRRRHAGLHAASTTRPRAASPARSSPSGGAIVVNGKEIPILCREGPGQAAVGQAGRGRGPRVDRPVHHPGRRRQARLRQPPGRRRQARAAVAPRPRTSPTPRSSWASTTSELKAAMKMHLQRLLHDQLAGPGLQGAAREDRHRQGPDDHRPRLHQRPGHPGHAVQGQASRPRRRAQHRALDHRRRQGPGRGHPGPEGQAARLRPARAGARPARSPT